MSTPLARLTHSTETNTYFNLVWKICTPIPISHPCWPVRRRSRACCAGIPPLRDRQVRAALCSATVFEDLHYIFALWVGFRSPQVPVFHCLAAASLYQPRTCKSFKKLPKPHSTFCLYFSFIIAINIFSKVRHYIPFLTQYVFNYFIVN